MRRWPGYLVTILCGWLAVVTSASADTAWILWSRDVATDTELLPADQMAWRRIATFDSKPACFTDASSRAEELATALRASDRIVNERKIEVQRLGLGSDQLAVKSTFTAGLYDGARMWTFYRCLPHPTVPRDTKAH